MEVPLGPLAHGRLQALALASHSFIASESALRSFSFPISGSILMEKRT